MFKKGEGDWTKYRQIFPNVPEIDFHFGERDPSIPYETKMFEVDQIVQNRLKDAQERGLEYIMFIHGRSTSRNGRTTARSVVRSFMRSKDATPLVEKRNCIQHETVFVAKIRLGLPR
jgi:phosphopentomutase